MFKEVKPQVSFPELEVEWLKFWKEHRVFEASIEARKSGEPFVFYEGPPTANGMPHAGSVLTRVAKDVFLRYRTLNGYYVPRRGGWDTHGLPVEVEVEKELGIHGRAEIERYGIEAFTRRCIDSVFRYIEEWRRMTDRIGFWVDFDNAYVTFHQSYVESIWWALAEMFKQGLLYQDYKVVWWWPQGGTALSAGEVGQGYKTVDDPSIMLRFPLADEKGTSFLAWTTTPWTLPSHVGLAVHPEELYATVETVDSEAERFVVAKALIPKVFGKVDIRVVAERKGSALKGLKYEPPFRYKVPEGGKAYEVVTADFVTLDTGTGIVHLAPAFGEDDFRVRKTEGLGFLQLVAPDGTFTPEVTDFAGRFCKEADRDIIRNLRTRGLLFKEESYRHEYPFCWRADKDPLIQYARRSWFIRTTAVVDQAIANNQEIRWVPAHIKDGRFGNFLQGNVDWALSRERYWGTPLPIWVNDQTGRVQCVASVNDILKKNPNAFDAFDEARAKDPTLSEHLRVHRPWIDQVTWQEDGEPGVYRRAPEVIDVWFDSGCMPFAQHGYPHKGQADFEREFPADFITEAVDQTRGWFYTLLMISTLLFKDEKLPHPFRNCVVLGLITDAKGQKLSKSKKNYDDPLKLMQELGADPVRWTLYSACVPGEPTKFSSEMVVDSIKEFFLKLWNVYSFFVTYARIDGWDPRVTRPPIASRSDLDRWILAELDSTVADVGKHLDAYEANPAARRIQRFVDALSNWYVRRSRARFWSEGDSDDKESAFATLYEVLVDLTGLLAPFTPFLAESLYQNLARSAQDDAPLSVHLANFPKPSGGRRDERLREEVDAARTVVTLGAQVRAAHKIKVRQPLSEAIAVVASDAERTALQRFTDEIRDELNVHTVTLSTEPQRYVEFSFLPNFRALGPRLGQKLPRIKQALAQADAAALYRELAEKDTVSISVDGEALTLTRDELEVRLKAKAGFEAASERGRVVILNVEVSPDLYLEGLAREVVNRLQRARKTLDLPFEARINIAYNTPGESDVAKAITKHAAYIRRETLAVDLVPQPGATANSATWQETDVEGTPFQFHIDVV